jgi:hypothetical protein
MLLMPMFDSRPSLVGLPSSVVLMVATVALMVIGFLWLHRTLEPGPLVRGESRWRYRDRARMEHIRRAIRSLVARPGFRTSGWWATRIEFGLAGFMLALATVALPGALSVGGFHGPSTLEILATSSVGYAGILIGIWWMRRIYLAPLEADSEAGWRYRDR